MTRTRNDLSLFVRIDLVDIADTGNEDRVVADLIDHRATHNERSIAQSCYAETKRRPIVEAIDSVKEIDNLRQLERLDFDRKPADLKA